MIESLFGDETCSWVSVNGINKYVTETSEETHIESIGESTRKLVAEARPQRTSKFNVVFLRPSESRDQPSQSQKTLVSRPAATRVTFDFPKNVSHFFLK